MSVIHSPATHLHYNITKFLISKGFEIKSVIDNNHSLLKDVISTFDIDEMNGSKIIKMCRLLIESGVDVNELYSGFTILDYVNNEITESDICDKELNNFLIKKVKPLIEKMNAVSAKDQCK